MEQHFSQDLHVRPVKIQIAAQAYQRLCCPPLDALDPWLCEDSDKTALMRRLIWVFAVAHAVL